MKRKILVGGGLVLLVLMGVLTLDAMRTPSGPPLRVGMTSQEAVDALRDDYDIARGSLSRAAFLAEFPVEPGDDISIHWALAHRRDRGEDYLTLWVSNDSKVKGWRVHHTRPPGPPWLDKPLKLIGL